MPVAPQDPKEWVDGFLFVGNQVALDFLNTRPVLSEGPTELLPDSETLVRWLIASGVLTSAKGKALARKWSNTPKAERFLEKLLMFREHLRAAVTHQEAGFSVSDAFISELNLLLEQHPSIFVLRRKAGSPAAMPATTVAREVLFEPGSPEDVWAPIAAGVASLLSEAPAQRVRRCEACVVHYYDTSKKGSRRWCSMNICGNRIKVASYQRRIRAAP